MQRSRPLRWYLPCLARVLSRLSKRISAWTACALLALVVVQPLVRANDPDALRAVSLSAGAGTVTSSTNYNHADALERQPRFIHIVTDDCTLRCLADRLQLPVTRLLTYNAAINAAGDIIPAGTQLIVPLPFPLLPEMQPLKVDVLEHRFVAVYRVDVPYARVEELTDWYRQTLPDYGYEIVDDKGNGALRLTGGRVARGTVEFSPGGEEHPTLIDVALVVGDPDH